MNNIDLINQNDHQALQYLITASSGFVDAYIIECFDDLSMILPQNIILSAVDCLANTKHILWHDEELPVYDVHRPDLDRAVALIVEAEDEMSRFALVCDAMPKAVRIRISELIDEPSQNEQIYVFQIVKFMNQLFQIPNLDAIQQDLKTIRE